MVYQKQVPYFAHKSAFCRNHLFRQTEVPAFLDSWVTNTPVEILSPQNKCFFLYFRKNVTRLSVGVLMMCQVFAVSRKILYS